MVAPNEMLCERWWAQAEKRSSNHIEGDGRGCRWLGEALVAVGGEGAGEMDVSSRGKLGGCHVSGISEMFWAFRF